MTNFNFLSKSSSQSCSHSSVTLGSTVGSPSAHRRGAMLKLIFLAMLFLIAGIGNVWGANWNKITNLSDLSNGDSILVVIQDGKTLTSGKAFKVGGTTSANSVDVTITSNSYISDPANNTKWAVNRSTSNNITTYTFTNGNSNKIATGSTSNGNIGGNGGTYYTWYLTKLSDGYFKVQYGNSSGMYISWKGSCFGKYANSSFVNQMTLSTKVNLAANHGAISFYKKAASTTPTITKSSEMTTLTYSNGSPVAQYFTVGGTNLTNNVTVTAPANGKYEVSTSQNSGYGNSVELSKGNGTLANTNVYIRLKSGLAGGNISADNISITSTGATAQTIAVTGSVPYTITWMANGSEHATTYVAVGGTLALPASNPVPNTCGCTGKTFYGWYGGASYSHASTAPSIAAAGNAVNADKTYHAVFADEGEEETPDPITQTLTVGSNGGTWPATGNKMSSAKVGDVTFTALGSGTNDGKYYTTDNSWRFYTNSTSGIKVSVPSGGIITKVKITWKTTIPATPSGWSRNQTTSPTTYTPNSGTEVNEVSFTKTSSGNVFFQVIEVTYTPAGGGTTYTNFETTCCTPLAQINGSVSVTNLSRTGATVSWEGPTSNASGYEYSFNGSDWANTGVAANAASPSFNLTGLTGATSYTIYLRAKGNGTTYSDGPATSGTTFKTLSRVSAVENNDTYGTAKVNLTNGSGWADYVDAADGTTIYLQANPTNTTYTFSGWSDPSSGSISNGQLTGWSGDVNLTANFALAELPKLPTPTGMASTVALNSATVSWNAVANATGYAVTCEKTSDHSTTGIVIGSINGTSCTISGLAAGTGYTWTVQALGDNSSNKNSDDCTGQTFTTLSITAISVQTAPKAAYLEGDNFDPTGLIITRTYSNSTTDTYTYAGHTGEFTFSPATNAALAANNDEVTITWNGLSTKQSINVYTVTVNKIDMGETPAAITAEGVTAGCSGRTLSQSVGSTNYKFNSWQVSEGGVTVSTNTITGTPTGNVIVNAKFHKPITVTWKVGSGNAAGNPTTEVKYGTAITALPNTPADNAIQATCGANKFMGWSATDELTGTGHSAPADLFTTVGGASALTTNTIYRAVFATSSSSAAANTILFKESFVGITADTKPIAPGTSATIYSGATITYDCSDGTGTDHGTTVVKDEGLTQDGSSPEIMLGKKGTTSGAKGGSIIISGIPSAGATALTISYSTNNNGIDVSVNGTGYSGSNSSSSKAVHSFDVTVSSMADETFSLTFAASSTKNVRLDDIEVKVKTAGTAATNYITGCCQAYTVTLVDANGVATGGTYDATPKSACEGTSVTLSKNVSTGYTFGGWTVMNGQTPVEVSNDAFNMPAANVSVQASFTPKHHNVVFHKNDGSETTTTQDFAFGVAQNLSTIATIGWTRSGFNFGGWMTTSNGVASEYTNGGSYTLNVDDNVNLYALWVPDNTRSITYNGDAHISSYTAQPATVAEDAANIAIAFALESNYELKSVAVTMGGAAIAADKIAFTQSSLTITAPAGGFTDNISITYTIEEMKYTVHFSINGNVTDKQVVRGQALNDIPTPGALTGFTFEGWASATLAETTTEPASYALSKTATSYTPSEDNVTFYAVYSRVEETELDGFKLSYTTSTPSTYYAGPMGSESYFSSQSSAANAEILFEEAAETAGQVYLYFYNGNTKTYIYATSSNANISKNTNKASAYPWTKGDEGNGKVSYTSTKNSKVIAYNAQSPRFAAYNPDNYDEALTPTAAKKTIEATYYSTTAVVPILDHITITTAPDKIAYFEGDDFDATGMVVTGTYNTGDKVLKASQYTISPSTNLEAGTTSVTIAAVEDNTKTASQTISVAAIELTSITITTQPTKKVYVVGQNFDPTGMVVTAHYNDDRKDKAVTGYTMTPCTSTALTAEDDHIEISYTEGGVTKTANQAITVNAALTGIEITTNPDKMTYIETETFDATGMVVTAHYNGSSDQIVTASVTWDKTGVLAALNSLANPTVETITFTYEELGAEVTTTLNVTVNPYPRYTVTFSANGTPTNVTETAGQGGVTVPANPAKVGDYTFAGWSKSQRAVESADDPALVTITAGKYYPEGAETLYAVYTMDHEDEVAGMYLTAVVDANNTEKTIGYFNNNSLYPTDENHSALALWYLDDYLFYMNGTTKIYLYNTGNSETKIFNVSENGKAADLEAAANNKWTKITNNDGTITFKRDDGRIIAWNNSSYFRCYGENTYPYNKFTATTASESITFEVPYYTTAPSADVTPTISFAETSKTITVVDENGALNTCTNALTTNSTGAVTYVSSDESIAEVAANGTVSVKAVGEVTITANVAAVAGTWKAISKSYTLTIEKATASASFGTPATTLVYKDNTIALPATSEQAITITYSSNDNTVATIDESGNVTGVATSYGNTNQRTVTIYANWAETDYYEASTNSTRGKITVTVKNNAKTQTLSFTDEAKDFGSDQGDKVYTNTLNGAKTSVTYASSDETVAEVDENTGEVTVHTNAVGSATITATAAAGNVIEDGIQYAYAQAQDMYVISIVYPRPTISVASCEFKAPFEVALSSEATNVEMIVYTTDGTDPSYADNNGDIYTEPIAINATTTLKAIAVSDEDEESPVATATYTKLVPELTEYSYEDNASLAANTEMTITASEGALVAYAICDANNVELTREVGTTNSLTFQIAEAGTYKIYAQAKWDVENGFKSATELRTVHIKGAVHLPISYEGKGTEITSEPYFTVEGNYVVDNYGDAYINAPIKIKNTGSLTAAFLDEPNNVVFYLGGNGVSGSTLKVQESADGENFEDVEEYTADDIPASVVNFETGYNGGGVKQNLNLKSTTRFVRWSYTKVSGNVALGKIAIYPKSMEPDNSYEVPVDFTGDVVVEDGVAWNITEAQTIHDLTVKQGAEVWNNEAITVNNLYIEAQEGKSGQITEDESITIVGNAYYDLTLNTSGTMDNSKWYAFAVPFQVDAATGIQRLSNDGKTSNAGFNSHYVLLKYNSAAYASAGQGWEYVTRGETLEPGKFYMIALNSNEYNRVRMTKKAGTPVNNKANLTLSTVGTGMHANWNALANNALAYANVSASGLNADLKVQVYNSAEDSYTAYEYGKVTFTVGTPFFIQVAEAGTMNVDIAATYNETVKAPARYTATTEEFKLRLGADTESFYDQLYVSASDEALNEYQIGHDLAKAGVSTTVPQMYIPAYGAKLCDAEFPLVNNEATFPLTFTAPSAGTYQLYISKAATDAELFLTKDGSVIWNLSTGAYALTLEKGTTENYGLLLKAAKTPTGVDEPTSDSSLKGRATKVVIDEHVYILRGGQMYDVTGKAVK